jgi:hypothetical protein
MLPAETAVLLQLDAVRGVLAVLFGVVIALFAFCAGKHNVGAGFFRCHVKNTSFVVLPARRTSGGQALK